jgi:prepilin-type N-terminal cleavage/methylation domain-containing protein
MTRTTRPRPATGRTANRRAGFTLVELLVVIAIVAILLAITGVALQKTVDGQKIRTSREQVYKLQQSLDIEIERVNKGCAKDQQNKAISPKVVEYCEGDMNRALAVWTAMKLRQQFPDTFAEATSPSYITMTATGTLALRTGSVPNGESQQYALNPLATFAGVQALTSTVLRTPLSPANAEESGALLYIILTQKSVGGAEAMAVSGDELGQQRKAASGLNTFADAYGNSIGFCRWYGCNTGEDEVQQAEYAGGVNVFNAANRDPLDPRNLVLGWADGTKLGQMNPSPWFFNGRNRLATVYSLGRVLADPTDDLMGYRLRRFGTTGRTTQP